MERTGHHCPIHKEPSLPVLFRKYRSQEEYGKGIAGIRHLFKKSSQPLPLLIADLKEEIIDEYLNREGLQEIKKMLYHPGYIPNTELPAVYSGASVFIYTSLRESFGIPILEAMACGTPVITSTTSAMPEIAGPEGILVNPFEPEEIASALLHLEENAEFYQSQTAYGLERVRRFSWENTAREILNIYKEILA